MLDSVNIFHFTLNRCQNGRIYGSAVEVMQPSHPNIKVCNSVIHVLTVVTSACVERPVHG